MRGSRLWVERFLPAERDGLLGTWTLGSALLTLTVPAIFYFADGELAAHLGSPACLLFSLSAS